MPIQQGQCPRRILPLVEIEQPGQGPITGSRHGECLAIGELGLAVAMAAPLAVPQPQPGLRLLAIQSDGAAIAGRRRLPLLLRQGLGALVDQQPVAVGSQQAGPLVLVGHIGMAQHPLELGDGERALIVAGIGLTQGPHEFGIPGIGGKGPLQLGYGGPAAGGTGQRQLTGAIGRRGPLRLLGGEQRLGLVGLHLGTEEGYVLLQLVDALGPDRHGLDVRQPDLGRLPAAVVILRHLPQQPQGLLAPTVGQVVAGQPAAHPWLTRILPVQALQRGHALGSQGGHAHLQQGIFHRHVEIRGQLPHEQGAIEALGLLQPAGIGQQPRLLQLLALGRVAQGEIGHALAVNRGVRRQLAEPGEQRLRLPGLALTQGLARLGRQQLRVIGLHQGEGVEAVADEILTPAGLPYPDLLEQPVHRLHSPQRQVAAHQAGEQATQGQSAWHDSLQPGCRVPSAAKR